MAILDTTDHIIVYVNPVYLSRLFKEKIGENFIAYLTNVRIAHAKSLLEDLSLRIYDITEMVGYESQKHFWKIFEDITGMSPKESLKPLKMIFSHQLKIFLCSNCRKVVR